MTLILITMLSSILALIMLIPISVWFIGAMLDRMVGTRNRQLEEMMDTEAVPIDWTKKAHQKIVKLNEQGALPEKIEGLQRKLKRKNIRKLNHLMKYIQTTNLVENEEVRSSYVFRLRSIYNNQIEQGELGWGNYQ